MLQVESRSNELLIARQDVSKYINDIAVLII